jgi:hypothetical protein
VGKQLAFLFVGSGRRPTRVIADGCTRVFAGGAPGPEIILPQKHLGSTKNSKIGLDVVGMLRCMHFQK